MSEQGSIHQEPKPGPGSIDFEYFSTEFANEGRALRNRIRTDSRLQEALNLFQPTIVAQFSEHMAHSQYMDNRNRMNITSDLVKRSEYEFWGNIYSEHLKKAHEERARAEKAVSEALAGNPELTQAYNDLRQEYRVIAEIGHKSPHGEEANKEHQGHMVDFVLMTLLTSE